MNINNLRSIIEKWENQHNYKSYFSSLSNDFGLNANPKIVDDSLLLEYKIEKKHMGIPNFAFGGISYSLLDGLMGWYIMCNYNKIGATLTNTIKYHSPLVLGETYLFKVDKYKDININNVCLIGHVYNTEKKLCIESKSIFYLKSELTE